LNDELEQAAQTAAEHGAAAAAAAGGRSARARPSRPAALSPDTPEGACANCAAELQGPVCHQCGQLADEYHRPVRGLVWEILEGVTSLDGRVARTIPNLLLRPGRVTRAYLKGARARFMPPFRLYIIASLIFFLLAPAITGGLGALDFAGFQADTRAAVEEIEAAVESGEMTREDADQALAIIGRLDPDNMAAGGDAQADADAEPSSDGSAGGPLLSNRGDAVVINNGDTSVTPEVIRRFFTPEDFGEPAPDTIWPLALRRHLGERFADVQADPRGWLERAGAWVPRIMFVMVPVYALLLSLVYAWRRRFFFYDHLMVSLHLHSALFLTASLAMVLSGLIGSGAAFFVLVVYSLWHLHRLQRVVYGRGRIVSALRTLTLSVLYFFILMIGFLAVLLLGALA
jgi:hypothetical protein